MRGVCGVRADVLVVLPPSCTGFRSPPADFKPAFFHHRCCPSIGWPRIGIQINNHRRGSLKVRASENFSEGQTPIAPVSFESPTGQLLSQIMHTHPHLLPSAIDQQLEKLQSDRDSQKEEKVPVSKDLPLYRRIAEVKDKERQRTLEEIIYCFIVYKFIENEISLIPALSPSSDPTTQVYSWRNQEQKLESLHSPDALEMIRSHITLVIGERFVGPLGSIVQISKLKLGKLYAASIMYGYFLKRVDERFQLERSMNTLPTNINKPSRLDNLEPNPFWDMESMVEISPEDGTFDINEDSSSDKSYRLRSYVMYLDAATLQRYATIRSKEAISLIEKQTQALFGRPDVMIAEDGSLNAKNDQMVGLTISGLTMLVLEAVAFGSFLWEAESYTESKYHFLTS